MKARADQIGRALDAADPAIRLFLLHGPDESGSRALVERLAKRMGAEAERIDLSGAALKADPARLADEAAAISLFGGPRWIRVDPIGDEALDAVQALLDAAQAGNPVAAITGGLRRDSKLLKLAEASPAAMTCASYAPEGRDAARLVQAMGRERGLTIDGDVAGALTAATGGNRALLARELDKFALYLDAAPERVCALERDAWAALGASTEEDDLGPLIGHALSGRVDAAADALGRLGGGIEGMPLIRAVTRRLLLLAQLRAQVDAGDSVERALATAGRAVFWKEQGEVGAQVARWTADGLATAIARLGAAERRVKSPGSAGTVAVEQELLEIARYAARRR